MTAPTASKAPRDEHLDLFCTRIGESSADQSPAGPLWEVTVAPGWVPPLLAPFFDQHGETAPMLLDLEDLDHFMKSRGASYEKRISTLGDVQLSARGSAAHELVRWLATAFSSGVRRPRS
ncbi:MAG: hypothetical protein GX607_12395 [Myxococcales bacterium]|jgi:hypothetical protein|nr:hypothetical protein [Myxococcales bacterium]